MVKIGSRIYLFIRRRWAGLSIIGLFVIALVCACLVFRSIDKYAAIYFGLISVTSVAISIMIFKQISKEHFSSSLAICKKYTDIFEDALLSGGKLSLIHFCPCPGLFDNLFNDDKAFEKFENIVNEVIEATKARQEDTSEPPLDCRIAMLGDPGIRKFLESYFEYEKKRPVKKSTDKAKYIGTASIFLTEKFRKTGLSKDKDAVDEQWLDDAFEKHAFIILAASKHKGFIGLISLHNGYLQFDAADYAGKIEIVHELYDLLRDKYTQPPNAQITPCSPNSS